MWSYKDVLKYKDLSFVGTEKSDKGLLFEDTKSQKESYSSPLTGSWTLIFGIIFCVLSWNHSNDQYLLERNVQFRRVFKNWYNHMECDGFESKFICNVRDLRLASTLHLVVGVWHCPKEQHTELIHGNEIWSI